MRVIIKNNYDTLSLWTAYYIMTRINRYCPTKEKPFVIGLPTGSSPLGVYKKLVEYYNSGKVSFENVVTFNMDEYVGLSKEHPESYYYFMRRNFFDLINIPEENINMLDGCANDLIEECSKYEEKIRTVGGIELFLGGVGTDGHIAFNEPGSSLKSRTRIKTLCQETIQSNSRFFDNDEKNVPTLALTVGLGTIMDANEILIIINGAHKANALKECLEGNVNNTWTITALQNHEKVIIACDKDATKELKVKTVEYFDNLQKRTNILGEPNLNYFKRFIKKDDKIIIFSPHPDDDVIGCGGTLQKFDRSNVIIVYMTDGSGGYDKSKYTHNPRRTEAILSLKVLGYRNENVLFLDLPFYKTKKITKGDFQIIENLLEKVNPQHIFVCNDSDPNKTHNKCYEIIQCSKLNENLKYVWLYNSAWGDWENKKDVNCVSYLDEENFNRKRLSIMMHDSQDPPKVFYEDNSPFYDKIINKNSSVLNPGYYEEQFKVITKGEFQLK